MTVPIQEAEDVLEEGQKLLSDTGDEKLGERLRELETVLQEEADLEEAVKKVRDAMERVRESELHDEPEMTPEEEREARETGPRDEHYREQQ
ncbi:MAG: hypothetical protein ABEJ75_03300 [Candidatus Nanohaloarchaea archaeon]